MTRQEAFEAHECFQFVCEHIRQDKVHPRSVLFGTTLRGWLNGKMVISVACSPPSSQYVNVTLAAPDA